MTHTVDGKVHKVTDDDKHFLIDIESKRITHPTETLPVLVQNDHNSERLSFDIPKIIDGHDITTCNLVQVHFINTAKDNVDNFNSSIYEVKDLKEAVDDTTKATFTWLIDQAGTHLAGPLTFAIQFACTHTEEGTDNDGNPIVKTVLDYAWNTHPFIGINVSDGMNNEEALSDQYYSAVDAWTETIKWYGEEAQKTAVAEIRQKQSEAVTAVTNTAVKSKSDAISDIDKHALEVKQNLTEDALDMKDIMTPSHNKYYYVSYAEYDDKDPSKSKIEVNYDEGEFTPDDDILSNSKLIGYTVDGHPVYDWSGVDNNTDLDYIYCAMFVYDMAYNSKIPNLKVVKDIVDEEVTHVYNKLISDDEQIADSINNLAVDINKRLGTAEDNISNIVSASNGAYIKKCSTGIVNPTGSDVETAIENILYNGTIHNVAGPGYAISTKAKTIIQHTKNQQLKLYGIVGCKVKGSTNYETGAALAIGGEILFADNEYSNTLPALDRFEIMPVSAEVGPIVTITNSTTNPGFLYIMVSLKMYIDGACIDAGFASDGDIVGSVSDSVLVESIENAVATSSDIYLCVYATNTPGLVVYSYNPDYDQVPSEVTVNPISISSIMGPTVSGSDKTYTIHLTDGKTYTFTVTDGKDGINGVSIDDIILDDAGDYEDTFSIELSDGRSKYFKIPNGNSAGVKTELSGPIIRADNVIPINHKVKTSLRSKNLINLDNVTIIGNGILTVNDDDITIQAGSDNEIYGFRITNENLGRLEIGKTYTASISNVTAHGTNWGWRLYYTDKTYESSEGSKNVVYTFTPKKEVSLLQFYVGFPYKESEIVNVYGIQLEEGDTATPCTSYVDLSTVTLTRCGKNIIPYPHAHGTGSSYGVNYTSNSDGTVTATGTATENSLLYMATQSQGPIHLVPGVYTLSGCPAGGSHSTYRITIKVPGDEQYYHDYGEGCTFEVTEDIWVEIYMFIGTGTTANALVFKPQLEVGPEATPYEPYTATIHKSTSDGILKTTPRSVSPTMTLFADKPGVIIDTVYNRDVTAIINEVFDNPYTQESDVKEIFHKEFEEATIDACEEENVVRRTTGGNIGLPDQTNCMPDDDKYPQDHHAVSKSFLEKYVDANGGIKHVFTALINGRFAVPCWVGEGVNTDYGAVKRQEYDTDVSFNEISAIAYMSNYIGSVFLPDLFFDGNVIGNPFGHAVLNGEDMVCVSHVRYIDPDDDSGIFIFRLLDSNSKLWTVATHHDTLYESIEAAYNHDEFIIHDLSSI